MSTLKVKRTTYFKQGWQAQVSELSNEDKYLAQEGTTFNNVDILRNENSGTEVYWKVAFNPPLQPENGRAKQSWDVDSRDVEEI